MPRPRIGEQVAEKLREFLVVAEESPPHERTLNVSQVARALQVSRRTLYAYGFDREIREAAQRQRQNARMAKRGTEREALLARIRQLRAELERARKRNEALVEQIALYEFNAVRFDIDVEELRKPDLKPDRMVPAFGGKGRGRGGRRRR